MTLIKKNGRNTIFKNNFKNIYLIILYKVEEKLLEVSSC